MRMWARSCSDVSRMTGMAAVAVSPRTAASMSKPFMPGICTSLMIRSGG